MEPSLGAVYGWGVGGGVPGGGVPGGGGAGPGVGVPGVSGPGVGGPGVGGPGAGDCGRGPGGTGFPLLDLVVSGMSAPQVDYISADTSKSICSRSSVRTSTQKLLQGEGTRLPTVFRVACSASSAEVSYHNHILRVERELSTLI